ncbi:MAG: Gfo/Idh/MocA family oxidoreductase [Kiritimatiellae bacterium]|nr:Gfo/Idh/MocA family oxidoreductase [Kiritimatiellia bacterium]
MKMRITGRREFLKGTAWMGAMAFAAGCASTGAKLTENVGAPMQGFRCKPMPKVRVGVIGLGNRGSGAVHRVSMIPGVEIVALCDIRPEMVDRQVDWLKSKKLPLPKRCFSGREEAWKKLCDGDDVDVIYSATPWSLHVPIALYAMRAGKHVMTEVPAAFTVDECWELVEISEKTKRNCMQLENCCYGEMEMLMLSLAQSGILGNLSYGECGYIHDLRRSCWERCYKDWRLHWNAEHQGNQYPTHGLGPVAWAMGINRGDRFGYLVSLESGQAGFEKYARDHYATGDWRLGKKIAMGDMNVTLVKTAKGKAIQIQHDVSSPRPYTRIDLVSGTKGIFWGMPWRVYEEGKCVYKIGVEETPGGGVHQFFDEAKAEEFRLKYRHPLWKTIGKIAAKVGGHGGMDFIMDLRWAYCLQNGLPLDMDVYDLAAWCSICELSEKSVRNRSRSVDVPDFTRGAWKNAQPLGLLDIDPSKMGLQSDSVKKDEAALNI